MKLSAKAQAKARGFMQAHARPLELAEYAYHFEDGEAQDVMAELSHFQNADGGFGRGLEPDLRITASSAAATNEALQRLRNAGAAEDSPLIRGAMRYLLDTYDPGLKAWQIIPAHDNTAPHAPWWQYDEDLAKHWRRFQANPRAQIIGHLFTYPNLAPTDLREELAEDALAFLQAPPTKLEMHDLLCYVRLAESEQLPGALRTRLLQHLAPQIEMAVEKDPAGWPRYSLKPLAVAGSPQSPFAELLGDAVQTQLNWEIERQGADGAWAPNWTWGDRFPDVWPLAEQEWKGILTLTTLRWLHNYDRLG